jgi:glyoxylase-like metal-dependent hydrolase (beta-lactamase superfamily II)
VEVGLKQLGLGLSDIDLVVATHAHPDHFEAARVFKDTPALFAMGESDWRLVEEMGKHLGAAIEVELYTPDLLLRAGDLRVKGLELQVLETPGHSPGSVSLYWPDKKALFPGDVIFREGLGRTDLPGGNGQLLKASIKSLEALDVEWVLPGHGEPVSGAEEVKGNFARVEQYWFGYI